MNKKNLYFPCLFVEHENDKYSIILSNFHYFDDYFGDKGAGGYTIDKLAKKLAKEHNIKKEIGFDSEAGMFCAYSKDKGKLLLLCNLLKAITGDEDQYLKGEETKSLISLEEAEKLLIKGFVVSLDKNAQKEFLENIPMPSLDKRQTEYLNAIKNGTAEEKIKASKKINSEARTKIRKWDNYLSHPYTTTIFLDAIDKEEDPKVYQELIWALVFICDRHLPDLRTQPYFLKALKSKIGNIRWLGVLGLNNIYSYPFENIMPLITDKVYKVREKIVSMLPFTNREFASWMFEPKQNIKNNIPQDLSPFFTLFNDKHRNVQIAALETLIKLNDDQIFPKLKELIPVYEKMLKIEDGDYLSGLLINAIEKLKKMK